MDERFGFIHEELDIKILILYILRRLPGAVDQETLRDLCQSDGGVGYFEFSECLNDLINNKNIQETEEGYKISEKGARNADAVESSLPFSVRKKVDKLIVPVEERLRRAAMITARYEVTDAGCFVELAMADGKGEVMRLRFLCAGEEQAKQIGKNFRRDAEGYYQKIAQLMTE